MILPYCNIVRRINEEVLQNKRSEYGKLILPTLSAKLVEEYRSNFEEKKLRRMIQFASQFPDTEIFVTLSRQLSWSQYIEITPLKETLQREANHE